MGLSSATLPCLQQLTHLGVSNLSADNLPQLSALTCLKALDFGVSGGAVVRPGNSLVFPASLVVLDVNSPVEAGVLSLLPTGLEGLQLDCVVQGPIDGSDVLLSGVGGLQHSTRLDLTCSEELVWRAAGPAYSALTGSSSLAVLALAGGLPEGSLSHVFPAERRLPHLITCDLLMLWICTVVIWWCCHPLCRVQQICRGW
jgi:hypothetical protein